MDDIIVCTFIINLSNHIDQFLLQLVEGRFRDQDYVGSNPDGGCCVLEQDTLF